MRKTTLSILATAFVLLSLHSCKKDDTETAQTNTTTSGTTAASFACKIDGVDFKADSSRVNFYTGGFSIMAFKAGTTAFEINLTNPAMGAHTLTPGGSEGATYIAGQRFYSSQTGVITIATIDSATATTTGTFNFVGFNSNDSTTKSFSAGTFSVN